MCCIYLVLGIGGERGARLAVLFVSYMRYDFWLEHSRNLHIFAVLTVEALGRL